MNYVRNDDGIILVTSPYQSRRIGRLSPALTPSHPAIMSLNIRAHARSASPSDSHPPSQPMSNTMGLLTSDRDGPGDHGRFLVALVKCRSTLCEDCSPRLA